MGKAYITGDPEVRMIGVRKPVQLANWRFSAVAA
jgi:hypothetical protein